MKKTILTLVAGLLLLSCADSKTFTIDGRQEVIEPYGWWNVETKHDSIHYELVTGNIVWSVLLSETVVAPLVFTGGYIYEPVSKKVTYEDRSKK